MKRFGLMARSSHSHKDNKASTSRAEEPEPSYRLKQLKPVHDTANINNSNSNNNNGNVKVNKENAGGVTTKKKKKKLTPQRKAKESSTTVTTKTSSSDVNPRSVMTIDDTARPDEPSRTHKNDKVMNMNRSRSSKNKQKGSAADVNAVRLRQPAHLAARGGVSGAGATGTGSGRTRPGLGTQGTERRTSVFNRKRSTKVGLGEQPQHQPAYQPAHPHHAPPQHQTQPQPQRRLKTKNQEEEKHKNVDAEVPTAARARPARTRTRNDTIIAAAKESSKSKPPDEPSAAPPPPPTRLVQEHRMASITSCMTLDSSFGSMAMVVSSSSRSMRSAVSDGAGPGGQDFVPPPSSARIAPMLPAYSEEGDENESEEGVGDNENIYFYGELERDDGHGAAPHYNSHNHSNNNNDGQDDDDDDWSPLRDNAWMSPSPSPPLSNAAGRKTVMQYGANDITDLTPIRRGSGKKQKDNNIMDDENVNVEVEVVYSDEVGMDCDLYLAEIIAANAIVKQHRNRRKNKKHSQPQRALHKQRGHAKARSAAARDIVQTQVQMHAEQMHGGVGAGVDKVPEPEPQEVAPPQRQREMPPVVRTCSRRAMQAMKIKSKLNERRRRSNSRAALLLLENTNARSVSASQSSLVHVDFRHVGAAILVQSAYRRYRAVYRRFEALISCISIQSVVRGFLCVTQFQDNVVNIIIGQSVVRRYLACNQVERRELALFEEQQAQEVEASQWYYGCAAAHIQASWRRYDAYWTYAQRIQDIVTCQSVVRRFLLASTRHTGRSEHSHSHSDDSASVAAADMIPFTKEDTDNENDNDNAAWFTTMAPITGFEVEAIPRFDVLGAKRDQFKSPARIHAVQTSTNNETDVSAWNPFADSDHEDDDSTRTFENDNDSSIDSGRVNLGHDDENEDEDEDDNYNDSIESIEDGEGDEDDEHGHDHYSENNQYGNYGNNHDHNMNSVSPNLSPIREVEHEVDTTPQRVIFDHVEADHVSVDSVPFSDPSLLTMVVSIASSQSEDDDEGDDTSSLGGEDSDISHTSSEDETDAEIEEDSNCERTQEHDENTGRRTGRHTHDQKEDESVVSSSSSSSVLLFSPPSIQRRINNRNKSNGNWNAARHLEDVEVKDEDDDEDDTEDEVQQGVHARALPVVGAVAVASMDTEKEEENHDDDAAEEHVEAVAVDVDVEALETPPASASSSALMPIKLKSPPRISAAVAAEPTPGAYCTNTTTNIIKLTTKTPVALWLAQLKAKQTAGTATGNASVAATVDGAMRHGRNNKWNTNTTASSSATTTSTPVIKKNNTNGYENEKEEEAIKGDNDEGVSMSMSSNREHEKGAADEDNSSNVNTNEDQRHNQDSNTGTRASVSVSPLHTTHKVGNNNSAKLQALKEKFGGGGGGYSNISSSAPLAPAPSWQSHKLLKSIVLPVVPAQAQTPPKTSTTPTRGQNVVSTPTKTTSSIQSSKMVEDEHKHDNGNNAAADGAAAATAVSTDRRWTPSSSTTRINKQTKQSSPKSVIDAATSSEEGGGGGVSGKISQWKSRTTTTGTTPTVNNAGNPFQPVRRVGEGNAARLKALQEKFAGGGNSN
jgi:hypothetical protein